MSIRVNHMYGCKTEKAFDNKLLNAMKSSEEVEWPFGRKEALQMLKMQKALLSQQPISIYSFLATKSWMRCFNQLKPKSNYEKLSLTKLTLHVTGPSA